MVFVPSGRTVGFDELERETNKVARALKALGLQAGDAVAICLRNTPELVYAMAGAMRVGLYFILLPSNGSASDLAYIVRDSNARLALVGADISALNGLQDMLAKEPAVPVYVQRSGANEGEHLAPRAWDHLVQEQADTLPQELRPGREMLYSSGSTGRPKGVRKPMPTGAWNAPDPRNVALARQLNIDSSSRFLSTSPLYHSAPLRFLLAALNAGATSVVMERFDAELALACIETHACTHSLWVPTMFQRMLRLDDATRTRYSVRSMTHAVHGAAPCTIAVKEEMIAWWGPVLHEYYSGTEGVGATWISSPEWMAHKGSVGRPQGCVAHVLDDEGEEVGAGVDGNIYFESEGQFSYWNDPQKTRAATSKEGWRTFGDIGYLDADGYLYLTDRRDFMLVSGGVNIYPQEVESALLEYPGVTDVAAFGVPDDDLGERLVAIVELVGASSPPPTMAADIQAFCRERMGKIKAPKQIVFVRQLPRHETGKLQKKRLREQFLRGEFAG